MDQVPPPAQNTNFLEANYFTSLTGYPKDIGTRRVHKLICTADTQLEFQRAAQAIINFLQQNQCIISCLEDSSDKSEIAASLSDHRYLVINGRALALARERDVPIGTEGRFRNRYFSDELLVNPVFCTKDHALESVHALRWFASGNTLCPAGDHELQPFQENHEFIDDLQKFRDDLVQKQEAQEVQIAKQRVLAMRIAVAENKNRKLDDKTELQAEQIHSLQSRKPTDAVTTYTNYGKLLFKLRGELLTLTVMGKLAGKETAQRVVKILPPIALIAGGLICVRRMYRGEVIKGIAELVSGAFACFLPGVGTWISVAIDLSVAGHDTYEATRPIESPQHEATGISKAYALQVLGIESELEDYTPKKKDVSSAFHEMIRLVHPDKGKALSFYSKAVLTRLCSAVYEAKDFLDSLIAENEKAAS